MRRGEADGARYHSGDEGGHYESWFVRGNHPSAPRAFWIRYTIFVPKGRPQDARGERWAIAFDGERGQIVAVKDEHPIADCRFGKSALDVAIAGSTLDEARLQGEARCGGHHVRWALDYTSPAPPLLLLDEGLYGARLPRAKALVSAPLACFDGELFVDGERWPVESWVGSQNHNWGDKHTDFYAWTQVAGFDEAPDAFLELATARVVLGGLTTPALTVMALTLDGETHRCSSIPKALRASGRYDLFHLSFDVRCADDARVTGVVCARPEEFVALPYDNPPGGVRTCLNTKIARCELTVRRPGRPPLVLGSARRAAFEILTDEPAPGVPRLVLDRER